MMLKSVDLECCILPVEVEINQLQDDKKRKEENVRLHDALMFQIFIPPGKIYALAEKLIPEVETKRKKKFKPSYYVKATKALAVILSNLLLGIYRNKPIRYSRDRCYYTKHKKFGSNNLTYEMTIPTIDALIDLGLIHHKNGRSHYGDRTTGTQARMWATPELADLFAEFQLSEKEIMEKPKQDLVGLTKRKKIKINGKTKKIVDPEEFEETELTQQIRKDLSQINNFVDLNDIEIRLNGNSSVNYQILFDIKDYIKYNQMSIININLVNNSKSNNTNITNNQISTIHNTNLLSLLPSPSPPHFTQMFSLNLLEHNNLCDADKFMSVLKKQQELFNDILRIANISDDKELKKRIKGDKKKYFKLGSIGVKTIRIRINEPHVRRGFCRSSFEKGGRIYGLPYQQLPDSIRRMIYINGEPTVELDYKALHPRMLYHMKGLEMKRDPYSICAGEEYRGVFKVGLLVSINAEDEKSAMGGIPGKLAKNGIPMPKIKNPCRWIVDKAKTAHPKIADFICSDMGVVLQNKDSRIMNNILLRLLDQNILGLPIHDSVIVQERHEQVLREIMLEEYENEMGGFSTEVDKK